MRSLVLMLLIAGCGGKEGTLAIHVVVSPIDDPFVDATQVRFTVGDSTHVKMFPVSGGHFDAKLDLSPLKTPGSVIVEALDSSGHVIAHGETPKLLLQPINQEVAVWVGRPGRIAPAAASLPRPLAEMASSMVTGLGVVYSGGRSTDGAALAETSIYDVLTHSIIPPRPTNDSSGIPPMQYPRGGAVAAVAGSNSVVIGGARSSGFGTTGNPVDKVESFSPTGGYGTWSTLTDAIPARSYPQVTMLGSGNALITGGYDEGGQRSDTGVLLTTSGTLKASVLSTPMAAPRAGHAVAPVSEGALIIGGLADGSTGPVAERLTGQAFAALEVPGLENRVDATATALASGAVLVVGGTIGGTAVKTGVVIDVSTNPPTVTEIADALSSARAGHSATRVGNDVLVCGGADDTGKLVGSCDLVSGSDFTHTSVALANPRRGHSAHALETGPVVLAGGFGDDGQPLSSIEIYTP